MHLDHGTLEEASTHWPVVAAALAAVWAVATWAKHMLVISPKQLRDCRADVSVEIKAQRDDISLELNEISVKSEARDGKLRDTMNTNHAELVRLIVEK